MTNKTTYYPPELKDTPIQGGSGSTLVPGATSKYVYAPPEIPSQVFPTYSRAREVVGPTLDTQSKKILGSFGFTKQGAFVVGSLSGPGVAMTQNGITAKNSSGTVTFAIDAATGNATFLGTIKVGTSIETGALVVGTNVGLGTAQDSAGVTTIIGNVVTTGYVNALNVTAQSVSASWVYAGNINANQITAGTLSANFISGGSLQIGGSSDSLGTIVVKNSSNTEIAKLNNSGIIVRNTRGLFFESQSGHTGDYFSIQNNGSGQAVLTLPYTNQFFIKDSAGTTNLFTVSSSQVFSEKPFAVNGAVTCKELILNYGQNEGSIRNLNYLTGYNDLRLRADSGKVVIDNTNLDMNEYTIDAANYVWAYVHANRSDSALKKYIKTAPSILDKLLELRVVEFNWRKLSPRVDDKKKHMGVIAQEIEEIFPSAVLENEDGTKGVDVYELMSICLSAVKDLAMQVSELKKSDTIIVDRSKL